MMSGTFAPMIISRSGCRVLEKPLGEGSTDFFDNTLKKHARLAARIKKQFEMLAPESSSRR